jgi:uncharacterized membrane protein
MTTRGTRRDSSTRNSPSPTPTTPSRFARLKDTNLSAPGRARVDLGAPRRRSFRFGRYDTETFGRFSETIARFIGTARFLVYQSAFIIAWITWNVVFGGADEASGTVAAKAAHRFSFDPYPFQFLTLILSLQAAYAAPLILLAQNRQEVRDQRQNERDRQVASRTLADAEFITRELASIRLGLADVATVAEVEKAFEKSFERAALKQARSEADGTSVKLPKPSDKGGSAEGTARETNRAK